VRGDEHWSTTGRRVNEEEEKIVPIQESRRAKQSQAEPRNRAANPRVKKSQEEPRRTKGLCSQVSSQVSSQVNSQESNK